MPPLPLSFLAYFALLPLFFSLQNCSLKDAVRKGLIFTLFFNLAVMYFLSLNSGAPFFITFSSFLVTALVLSLFGPIFTVPLWLALKKFGKFGLLAAPFFWAGMEYLKSLGEIAAPWNITPLTQSPYLLPIQIVSLTGVWGLSFWVAALNTLLYLSWKHSPRWLVLTVIIFAAPFILGVVILKTGEPPAKLYPVAVIQGNVDPQEKWSNSLETNLNIYRRLTQTADSAALTVWPEAAIPVYLNASLQARQYLRNLVQDNNTPILTGALTREYSPDNTVKRFNSAYLVQPGVYDFPRYDKIHLVPGGERIPFQKLIPALGKLNFGQAEFSPGEKYTLFSQDSLRFGVMICFESVFADIARRFTVNGADFLVNITNDGWYGKSAEPYQQALLTRFRAIENRRSMIRAANTGISYLMDGYGRFIRQSQLEVEAILVEEIPLYAGNTFYTRYGDLFAKSILLLSGIIVILSVIPFKKISRLFIILVLFIVLPVSAFSGETRYLTLSNVNTKSFSLASPVAMEGGLMSPPVNPAGLCVYRDTPFPRISVVLNPLGAALAFQGMQEGAYANSAVDAEDFIVPAALLFKAIGFSYQPLNVGIIFCEQMPGGRLQDSFFEYYPVLDNYFNRAFVKIQLHQKVQIGASAEIFAQKDRIDAVGYSYGVIMKPGKINVGVFYHTSPPGYENQMLAGRRLVSETINVGLSYSPVDPVKFYGGLRNISESKSPAFMEIHSGLEFTPWNHFSLRAGYFLEDGDYNSFSFGLGLLDLNEFRGLQDKTDFHEYLLEYTIVKLREEDTLHSFSLNFRL